MSPSMAGRERDRMVLIPMKRRTTFRRPLILAIDKATVSWK